MPVHVIRVDHAVEAIARDIHAVRMIAYAQEARLLGVADFPPLRCTVDDIRSSHDEFFVAYLAEHLVGCISVQSERQGACTSICSLVVAPAFQRLGVAKKLMAEVLRLYGQNTLTVQTGVRNAPALSLYTLFGFSEWRRWSLGEELLEVVELRRIPTVLGPQAESAA
jgi:ribosomal protein S18 acetylase RimI-like enzyme